jgi:membrane protein
MFAVLKAFGVQNQIEPFLVQVFEPLGPEGVEVARRIVEVVNNIQVGVLGVVGVVLLFYTVIFLVGEIERALNRIWRARRPRSWSRRLSGYLSVLLIGSVLVFMSLTLAASMQSYWVVQRAIEIQPFGPILATRGTRLLLLWLAFTFLYRFIPHTRVQLSSALIGGGVAGLLWQLAGVVFAAFFAGSARYAAIYSSFAVLILSLLWLYVGWLIVLIGAEVAYFHQHPTDYFKKEAARRDSYVAREQLVLGMLIAITQRALDGRPPWAAAELAARLQVPLSSLEDCLDRFVHTGMLLRATEPAWITLGRPPERISLVEILDTLRGVKSIPPSGEDEDPIADILQRRDHAVQQALTGVTLSDLSTRTDDTTSG